MLGLDTLQPPEKPFDVLTLMVAVRALHAVDSTVLHRCNLHDELTGNLHETLEPLVSMITHLI